MMRLLVAGVLVLVVLPAVACLCVWAAGVWRQYEAFLALELDAERGTS